MAQGEFKHITVTPADEDDVVINAGVSKPSATIDSDFVDERDSADDVENVSEDAGALSRERRENSAKIDAAATGRISQGQRAEKKDDYHEATLEDLQGEPMSLTQKAVIIAAVVCIIGALIYYFVFLR